MKDLINDAPIQQEAVWREITAPIFPKNVYKCSLTFKGGYDIDMNNLYRFCFIDRDLRSILLYVYVFLIFIKVL